MAVEAASVLTTDMKCIDVIFCLPNVTSYSKVYWAGEEEWKLESRDTQERQDKNTSICVMLVNGEICNFLFFF